MYFVQKSRAGKFSFKDVIRAEQSSYIARQSATVYLYLSNSKVTIITDDSPADAANASPEVSIETTMGQHNEFCSSEYNDSGVFAQVNGRQTYLDIGNLVGLGLAKFTALIYLLDPSFLMA